MSSQRFNNLPHLDLAGHYQFVTFRTHDSIDDYLKKIAQETTDPRRRQYRIDQHLDHSSDGAYLHGEVLTYLRDYLLEQHGKLYDLVCFSIMPNHVHILFNQKRNLSTTLKIIKGSTAHAINTILNRKGTFWESSYYDKAIRNEDHFVQTYEYIKNNPLKAGLDRERFVSVYE